MSTSSAHQRKLPIPSVSANINPTLKGILIKPKRILPAQPDNPKLKRSVQESDSEYKADDNTEEITKSSFNSSLKGENVNRETLTKCAVPKLQIDVDRLKSYFQLQGSSLSNTQKKKTDLIENKQTDLIENKQKDLIENNNNVIATEKNGCVKSDYSRNIHSSVTRENTFYTLSSDGLSKVKEWCSMSDLNRMTAKMSTDRTINKSFERSIRSPSPKSNTTWDRSSSGYSSDERADPRSPPPTHSTPASVSSKTGTEVDVTHDDDISESGEIRTNDNTDAQDIYDNTDYVADFTDKRMASKNELAIACSGTHLAASELAYKLCDHCDTNNTTSLDKFESGAFGFPFENTFCQKTNTRRPVLTANSALCGNGRIQYRKSISEPVISLRHPNRQAINDFNLDGLEVCGKSFQQTTNNLTDVPKLDSLSSDVAKCEIGARSETIAPSSALALFDKPTFNIDTGPELQRNEPINQDLKAKSLRQQYNVVQNLRGFRPVNVKLKDDRDIRKSLHDLNSPRRLSPDAKSVPVRARHILPAYGSPSQPMNFIETVNIQTTASTSMQRTANNSEFGKLSVKHFGKKMWRAPSGQPENAQMRPFSPFGGTLPPAKIKEQENKKHKTDETAG